MKFFLKIMLFFITSFGFFWSHLNFVNIVFKCECNSDIFPKYYALPFIYKADSLASSMATEYFVLGIFLNTIFLTILFLLLDYFIKKLMVKTNKVLSAFFLSIKILIIIFSIFNIYISYTFLNNDTISWKSDFQSEVKIYKAQCKVNLVLFGKYFN